MALSNLIIGDDCRASVATAAPALATPFSVLATCAGISAALALCRLTCSSSASSILRLSCAPPKAHTSPQEILSIILAHAVGGTIVFHRSTISEVFGSKRPPANMTMGLKLRDPCIGGCLVIFHAALSSRILRHVLLSVILSTDPLPRAVIDVFAVHENGEMSNSVLPRPDSGDPLNKMSSLRTMLLIRDHALAQHPSIAASADLMAYLTPWCHAVAILCIILLLAQTWPCPPTYSWLQSGHVARGFIYRR